MAQGPHEHKWHYNDAETWVSTRPSERVCRASRYCKICLKYEELKLNRDE